MRALVTILIIVVLVVIVAVATGFVNLRGSSGALPRVAVEGGRLPALHAEVGHIDLGTRNETVAVPKVATEQKRVAVPTLTVQKPQ